MSARLLRIFQQYSRYERAEVVRAAVGLQTDEAREPDLAHILEAARSDRSWIVRNAANEADARSRWRQVLPGPRALSTTSPRVEDPGVLADNRSVGLDGVGLDRFRLPRDKHLDSFS